MSQAPIAGTSVDRRPARGAARPLGWGPVGRSAKRARRFEKFFVFRIGFALANVAIDNLVAVLYIHIV